MSVQHWRRWSRVCVCVVGGGVGVCGGVGGWGRGETSIWKIVLGWSSFFRDVIQIVQRASPSFTYENFPPPRPAPLGGEDGTEEEDDGLLPSFQIVLPLFVIYLFTVIIRRAPNHNFSFSTSRRFWSYSYCCFQSRFVLAQNLALVRIFCPHLRNV